MKELIQFVQGFWLPWYLQLKVEKLSPIKINSRHFENSEAFTKPENHTIDDYEFTIRLISLNNFINILKIFGFCGINSPLRRSLRHSRILPKNRFCENWNWRTIVSHQDGPYTWWRKWFKPYFSFPFEEKTQLSSTNLIHSIQ